MLLAVRKSQRSTLFSLRFSFKGVANGPLYFFLAAQLKAFVFLNFGILYFLLRTRYQCLGLHQKKASNVCQKTREDQGSSENDERCEFEFVFGNSSNVLDLEKEEPTEWP